MKKKVREKDSYVKGLLAAEELFKEGYYFAGDREDGLDGLMFKHPEYGTSGYLDMEYRFQKGMKDYVEHRRVNPDIFGTFITGYVYD